ncbi:dTDP-6-deoxy-L-hexose 3-O-methyltransferase [Helicobacter cinaedi CCUG 18818 = ATCC BAA-847]|uniref:dTDP-6-deoxy-L-hexose 3-O-methyltransferase n=1 Tax=Helicobacter cinaedi CCUG 18818 = ATCC BAA-847 TaxID=537971 RepID=A0AAI8MK28_9HELI|nr:TylF/MycF/NovP-related O-methyltransferase [Helicobacter cinaedi]BAM32972.1 dTDP-6-deoxy-L-hexose 3-O-methyltransferase [Helicobacter cinaedi CCUG 18818 = ATCC BAA-847]
MTLNGFKTKKSFHYENGFYACADDRRFGKFFAHYELYKKIINLPGDIVECGIFKGNSFFRLAHFRNILETQHSRKIIGFDMFGKFPATHFEADKKMREGFVAEAGDGIAFEEMKRVLSHKNITNYELIEGDINLPLPQYCVENPQLKIAFLHIDTDIYEPAVTILESLYDKVVRGGIIAFDDYGTFPGETKAADDFLADKAESLQKLPISHIPSFLIKS